MEIDLLVRTVHFVFLLGKDCVPVISLTASAFTRASRCSRWGCGMSCILVGVISKGGGGEPSRLLFSKGRREPGNIGGAKPLTSGASSFM